MNSTGITYITSDQFGKSERKQKNDQEQNFDANKQIAINFIHLCSEIQHTLIYIKCELFFGFCFSNAI